MEKNHLFKCYNIFHFLLLTDYFNFFQFFPKLCRKYNMIKYYIQNAWVFPGFRRRLPSAEEKLILRVLLESYDPMNLLILGLITRVTGH